LALEAVAQLVVAQALSIILLLLVEAVAVKELHNTHTTVKLAALVEAGKVVRTLQVALHNLVKETQAVAVTLLAVEAAVLAVLALTLVVLVALQVLAVLD
jgi:hypothetical protein